MKSKLLSFLTISFLMLLLDGCSSGPAVLATVGDDKVLLNEFEESYAKNNGGWDKAAQTPAEDREKYLDLLIRFKTKVYEAKKQGLQRDSAIQDEMRTYAGSVSSSYILEKELIEPGIQRQYDRRKEILRIGHILFRCSQNASPAETLDAYNKAMDVIKASATASFDTLAVKLSEDRSALNNKGDLGNFSTGRLVPEFEDGMYQLQAGQISKTPVRSRFGYHVIKVSKRFSNPGMYKISHILRRFGLAPGDTTAAKDTIEYVAGALRKGMAFRDAAAQYSQDQGSSMRSGEVGTYEMTQLPPELGEYIFSLPLDSVSAPYKSNFGYHLFKVTEITPVAPLSESQNDVRQQYQQFRFEYDNQKYMAALKQRYQTAVNPEVVTELTQAVDSTMTTMYGVWSDTLREPLLSKKIVTMKDTALTVADFAANIRQTKAYESTFLTPANVRSMVDKFADAKTLEHYSLSVATTYPQYRHLMKEYEEGILLYRIEQDEVWKKVVVNDSILNLYYQKTINNYRWPERVNFCEIWLSQDSVASEVLRMARGQKTLAQIAAEEKKKAEEEKAAAEKSKKRKGAKAKKQEEAAPVVTPEPEYKTFEDLAAAYTMRQGYKDKKGVWGLQPYTTNALSENASKMAIDSITGPLAFQGGFSVIKCLERDSAHVKSFEDAKPEVASAYQETASKEREQQWVESLKARYNVTVFREVLQQAFKKKPE